MPVSADAMKRVRDVLVARRGTQRIVVCSARRRDQCPDSNWAQSGSRDVGYANLLDALIERHRKTLDDLGMAADADVRAELNCKFDRLRSLCAGICLLEELSAKSMDQLVSFGERLAVPMVHAWLDEAGLITRRVDARDWIATDDQFGAAEVDRKASSEIFERACKQMIPLKCSSPKDSSKTDTGDTTTLGRGGSDYTASLIASAIDAACLEKSTDVPGMLTANPRSSRSSSHC